MSNVKMHARPDYMESLSELKHTFKMVLVADIFGLSHTYATQLWKAICTRHIYYQALYTQQLSALSYTGIQMHLLCINSLQAHAGAHLGLKYVNTCMRSVVQCQTGS